MTKKNEQMKIKKTWVHIHFTEGDAGIEVMMNYETNSYTLMSDHEDQLIAINSESDDNIETSVGKAKCIIAALKYIKAELNLG